MERLVASGRVRVRISGQGRPLVLFHSLLADATSWDALAPLLAQDHQVVVCDLPGFAGLPPIGGGLAPVAAALGAAIAELRLTAPPVAVGNGYGSFLALRLALDQPGRLAALALLGCGARFSDPGRAAFRGMREAAAARGLEAVAETAMARLFGTAFRAANPALMDARRAAFLATDPATFAAACAALEGLDLEADVPRLDLPALLLAGSEDQATPAAMAQALAGLMPRACFTLLDGLAHVPQLQAPARVAAELRGFLAGV